MKKAISGHKSEQNQNNNLADEISFGEPSFSSPDDSETFTPARIRRFAESVLSAEAWFRSADELIAAMDLLEPHVERFWEHVRSLGLVVDQTSDAPSKYQASDVPRKQQKSDVPSKHDLINQHMMLAGFAIENLCKGYLAGRLGHQEREKVRAGVLPKSLTGHDILKLVEQTGMPHSKHFHLNTLCDTEKFLLKRITEAVLWRGRYPSAASHKGSRPFARTGSDIGRIKRLLQKVRRHVRGKDS
jgi:hypothetical protein